MERGKNYFPFAVYDTRQCCMVHLGLYENEDDVWRVYLGWPDQKEIDHYKAAGLRVIPVTVQYDPPR